jgi:hypothetical protein
MGVLARALLGEVDAVEAMTAAVKLLDAASRHVAVEGARRECLGLPS